MKKKQCTSIGGQAVMEGVMMRGLKSMATAVRDPNGKIVIESERLNSTKKWYQKVPVIRGFVNFFSMMIMGTKILMRSAEVYGDEEPSEFEKKLSRKFHVNLMSVVIGVGLILGIGLSVALFIILPETVRTLVCDLFGWSKVSFLSNLFAGLVRILIFILYIVFCSLIKDVKRVFMYHGAEHKTINCFESGLPLTVENVEKSSRIHDRCGTNFMFIVMFVSIIFFSLLGLIPGIQETWILRVGSRIILLPLVAGVSYEVLKILAKWDNLFVRILKAPGLLMQKITTKEPTPDMIEVGITAFETVRKMDADETIPAQSFNLDKRYSLARLEVENILHKVKDPDPSDAEWIFSRVTGKKRSELESLKYIKPEEYAEAIRYANERAKGIPLQYVFGDTEFYGLVLHVDERVLIPRPETELLAEEVVKRAAGKSVLDLCTGSGAIAIAVKKLSDATVTASDVSSDALDVAKKNAEENGADIQFVQSDMFENIVGKYDIIVSNPPYIPASAIGKLSAEVKKEPVIALDGGRDGLNYYRIIAEKAKEHLAEGGTLLLEVGIGQAESVAKLLGNYGKVEVRKDYNNIDRIIIANV